MFKKQFTKNSSLKFLSYKINEDKELKMNKTDEVLVSQKVQIKFSQHFSHFSTVTSKTEHRFLKDTLRGILSSRSCILRQIAQSLEEKIALEKVCKRLRHHLDKPDLNDRITEQQIRKSCYRAPNNTLYIVDPSDIFKPYAKKMEGLSRVRDGSTGKNVNGYETLNIISAENNNQELLMKPIVSKLFSYEQEIDTAKTKIFDSIISMIIASNNKGVYVFDRGFDDKKVFSFFKEQEAGFIIRCNTLRDLYYQGKKMKFKEVVKKANLSHTFTVEKKDRKGKPKIKTVYAGIIDVGIPLSPHPRKKNPDILPVKLLVAKYKDGGYWYLYGYLPNHSDLSEKEMVEFMFNAYKIRWKIEEVHRHIKQDFHWEDMRLGKYKRLELLNTILWLAAGFLYNLQSMKYQFIKAFHYFMLDKKNKIEKLPEFLFYRIALVVNKCFSITKSYLKTQHKKRQKEKDQLMLPFSENFLGVC